MTSDQPAASIQTTESEVEEVYCFCKKKIEPGEGITDSRGQYMHAPCMRWTSDACRGGIAPCTKCGDSPWLYKWKTRDGEEKKFLYCDDCFAEEFGDLPEEDPPCPKGHWQKYHYRY